MGNLVNLDLLSVGIAIAGIGILGFVVYSNNKKSVTNKSFLFFSTVTITWGIVNYLSYQSSNPILILWLFRLIMFTAVWQAYTFFQLMFVFPSTTAIFSRFHKILILPLVFVVSLITLSPFLFSEVIEILPSGQVSDPDRGPGIIPFGLVSVGLVLAGFYFLIKKLIQAEKPQKRQFTFVLIGSLLMFVMIIVFNFIFPAFLNIRTTLPLGALFILPFVFLTGYSIMKYKLLSVKVVTTEIIVFVLSIVTLFEVIAADNLTTRILRSGIFSLALAFGILLIKSVRKEVEQREELAKINIELRKAKLELEKLSQFKSQMLRLASHQIKAPLATIKGFASIIIEGLYGPVSDKIKETVVKMKDSSDELIKLINDLLDLSKVEQGRMEYKFETVKFKDLVQNVFDGLKIQADAKKLQYTLTSTSEANVNADPQKLKQVLANLVENSIKYTNSGFVKVESRDENGFIIFSVSDSGLGIGPNLLPHLFDQEFVRDERVKREVKGTGLGLYIAKSIVVAHGGTIWAESPGENKGSNFFVKLRRI